jgi:uncharacterized protein (DUF1697 family)
LIRQEPPTPGSRQMPTFVALLRGVNVGKAKRLPMAELRALLVRLGYTRVATLLNSGNVVFQATDGTAASHARAIAQAISDKLKMEVPVIVKTARELSAIIAENPIKTDVSDYSKLLVGFVQDPKTLADLEAVKLLVVPPERFVAGKRAAYLWCAVGILESKAAVALLGKAGRSATSRNVATVLKLEALAKNPGQD